ncbi:MAG: sensor histidine kinase, partial [Spirochaetota bacterium]
ILINGRFNMLVNLIFWTTALIFAISIVSIGILIFIRKRKTQLSFISLSFTIITTIFIVTGVIINMENNNYIELTILDHLYYINLFSGYFITITALLWSLTFPKVSNCFNIKNIILILIIGISSFLSFSLYIGELFINNNYQNTSIYYFIINRPHISLIYPLILNFIALVLAITKQVFYYKKLANDREKGKIRFFLTGFIIAIILSLISPFIMENLFHNSLKYYLSYIGLSIGIFFASYSIIKIRTTDLPIFFRNIGKIFIKSIFTALPVALITSIYINTNLTTINIFPQIIIIMFLLILYYLYLLLMNKISVKLFEKPSLNAEVALKNLFDDIVGVKSLKLLAQIIMNGLSKTININEYSFYIKSNDSLSFELLLSNEKERNKLNNKLFFPKKVSEILAELNIIIERHDNFSNLSRNNKAFNDFLENYFDFFEYKLLIPIIYDKNVIAIINIKSKYNNEVISNSDIEFIKNLREGISVAIMNAILFDNLIKEREKLEERVRKRTIDLTISNSKLTETLKELEEKHKELQETQLYLLQSEKMASLGELVAGVTHEVNSPLGTIQSSSDMLSRLIDRLIQSGQNDKETKEIIYFLERLSRSNREAVGKITSVFNALKQFSKLDEAVFKYVNIEKEIDYIVSLLKYKTKNRINIIKEYGNVPELVCYAGELNQVFMNLLTNSIESIEGKGEITIKTFTQNNKVNIIIKDTGKGIPENDITRVFNPGYTTKGVGIGTGMGLSVTYNIIKKHKGDIHFESQEGKGTLIKITLSNNLEK